MSTSDWQIYNTYMKLSIKKGPSGFTGFYDPNPVLLVT